MKSLPEILREEAEIIDQIEMSEGSIDDEILELKKANDAEKELKIDNYGKALRRFEAEANMAKEMENYWKKKRQSLENQKSRFKDWVQYLVLKLDGEMKSSSTSFTLQNSPPKLVIDPNFNMNNLPKEFCRVDIKPDLTKIKDEFESLPEPLKKYMRIEQGQFLKMKGGK